MYIGLWDASASSLPEDIGTGVVALHWTPAFHVLMPFVFILTLRSGRTHTHNMFDPPSFSTCVHQRLVSGFGAGLL